MPFLYPRLPHLSQRLETSPAHTTVTLGQTLRYAATDFAHVPSAGDGSRQHHAQHRAPPSHPACSMGCPCLHPPAHPGPHFAESPPALEPKSPTTHISQHPLRLPPAQEYPPLYQSIPIPCFSFSLQISQAMSFLRAKGHPFWLPPAASGYTCGRPRTQARLCCGQVSRMCTSCMLPASLGGKPLQEIHYFLLAPIKPVP